LVVYKGSCAITALKSGQSAWRLGEQQKNSERALTLEIDTDGNICAQLQTRTQLSLGHDEIGTELFPQSPFFSIEQPSISKTYGFYKLSNFAQLTVVSLTGRARDLIPPAV